MRFSIKNVLSFYNDKREDDENDAIQFSMNAGNANSFPSHINRIKKNKLLKFKAIYGANASGKSNLIKAMMLMKDIVMHGHLTEEHTNLYCKINEENKNKSSYFEMEIELSGMFYAYGFECILNESRIITEWLVKLKPSSNFTVFDREINSNKFNNGLKNDALNVYHSGIGDNENILFLNEMNRNKEGFYQKNEKALIYKEIFNWFKDSLDINLPNRKISGYFYLLDDKNFVKIVELLKSFGTGISDFRLNELSMEQLNEQIPDRMRKFITKRIIEIKNNPEKKKQEGYLNFSINNCFYLLEISKNRKEPLCKELKFVHNNSSSLFEVSEESDGTIRLLDLLEILLTKQDDKVFVIDEIDRCLHPNLTYKFLQTFLESLENRNIQLITTSHESRIMDLKLLRRDEIGFVKKNQKGESAIYSLDEYKTRFDQRLDKAYLEGRYDAVPKFSPIISDSDEDCK